MNHLYKSVLLLIFSLLSLGGYAQELQQPRVFILIRHAEQEQGLALDPPLSENGTEQARLLADLLKDQPVAAIYATPYRRTQDTALPLAEAKGLKVQYYDPSKGEEMAMQLKKSIDLEGAIVFVGHSNTIPLLANTILEKELVGPIAESEYGQIFIITYQPSGENSLLKLRLPEAKLTK